MIEFKYNECDDNVRMNDFKMVLTSIGMHTNQPLSLKDNIKYDYISTFSACDHYCTTSSFELSIRWKIRLNTFNCNYAL